MEANDFRTGVFAEWQPVYAEHNIPTFPCRPDKRPAVATDGRFGLPASKLLASRTNANAFGFMCGKRSGVTVLDWDSTDERGFADALNRHGHTPIIARSGSGNFQAWYRHAGERRLIRPRRDVPIDILGGGYVVAPPSRVQRGQYQFLQGSLDDLSSLPTLIDAPAIFADLRELGEINQGERNKRLFGLCLEAARHSDDFDTLCDVALTRNNEFPLPLDDDEVMKVAASAWRYEVEGRNYIGGRRAVFSTGQVLPLTVDPRWWTSATSSGHPSGFCSFGPRPISSPIAISGLPMDWPPNSAGAAAP